MKPRVTTVLGPWIMDMNLSQFLVFNLKKFWGGKATKWQLEFESLFLVLFKLWNVVSAPSSFRGQRTGVGKILEFWRSWVRPEAPPCHGALPLAFHSGQCITVHTYCALGAPSPPPAAAHSPLEGGRWCLFQSQGSWGSETGRHWPKVTQPVSCRTGKCVLFQLWCAIKYLWDFGDLLWKRECKISQ
jgi:hypothetical protein